MLPCTKRLNEFKRIYPFWASRVAKWQPVFPFGVKIWLTDGNCFIFSQKGKHYKLTTLNCANKKGMVVYDSSKDGRKGL